MRGENGGPGHHELYWGELDDAKAAARWLAARPEVDAGHLYAFGHSAGGVLAALLSLDDDVPYRLTGSAGGLYDETLFAGEDVARQPFDRGVAAETQLRVFPPNARFMKRAHPAYLGKEDPIAQSGVAAARASAAAPLEIVVVDGDHLTSLGEAVKKFSARLQADVAPPPK